MSQKLNLLIAPVSVLIPNEVHEFVVDPSAMWKKKPASRTDINKDRSRHQSEKAY